MDCAALGRNPLGMRDLWCGMANIEGRHCFPPSSHRARIYSGHRSSHQSRGVPHRFGSDAMGPQHPSQVSQRSSIHFSAGTERDICSVFERHHRFVGWIALFLTCKVLFHPLHHPLTKFL